ncbi:hypothetical protein [Rhizobium aethiopicum]|uniref:hypothetical protein n=1 Tax=Rhizobium aethiopicum TaxID=1138170 RepID=UPI0011306663|nr:hypothetical protein [Rhizobium aethiopicum]
MGGRRQVRTALSSLWLVDQPASQPAQYIDLADERFEMKEGGGDQLGGWEEPIQGNMHGEVELISSGKADSELAYAKTVLSAGERWRHVLTINAETYLWRLMPTWGDGACSCSWMKVNSRLAALVKRWEPLSSPIGARRTQT